MKIGLISDTHMPGAMPEMPPQLARAFAGVDLILHAGDIYGASCLDWLQRIAPVLAVEVYSGSYWSGDPRVVVGQRVLSVEGYAVGLTHMLTLPGMRDEMFPGAAARDFSSASLPDALCEAFGKPVDIVVFGDTHYDLVEEHQGVLLVNPGSATLPKHMRRLGTVAVLELTWRGRSAQVVDLAKLG
ncbi:MAG: metallophosphoesterase [Dehalococcoidia bacterium]|nr:metallophosphoesterase [Dehalococcoidia bacterium]